VCIVHACVCMSDCVLEHAKSISTNLGSHFRKLPVRWVACVVCDSFLVSATTREVVPS